MKYPIFKSISVLAILAVVCPLAAAPITVDGACGDWGLNPSAGDWDSSTGSRIFFEDGVGPGGLVGPGWGGQAFDVEAIYADFEGSKLYFAVVTGFNPAGTRWGPRWYTAGDVYLTCGDGSGVVGAVKVNPDVSNGLAKGHLYTDVTSSSPTDFPESGPHNVLDGTDLGTTPFAYTMGNKSHYVLEGMVNMALLGMGNCPVGIFWTMSCGNDFGNGRIAPPSVPEPATLGLFGLGSAIMALVSRRRKSAVPTA